MRINNERGQSMVLTFVFLVVLMGMSAAVLDVGSWYRAHRSAQSTADAAALAGAQGLTSTTEANALAQSYAGKNGGGLKPSDGVVFSTKYMANDTISVHVERQAPGFFSKVFGLGSVTVGGRATARAYVVTSAKHVAPITVNYKHDLLNCTRGKNPVCNPTYGVSTTLNLADIHQPGGGGDAAGSFGLINLNPINDGGNVGADVLADWLMNGFDKEMPLGDYNSAPSANFNNSQFTGALDSVLNEEVLFPVYRLLTGPGANARYDIIGWIGFYIRSYDTSGNTGTLTGEFSRYVAEGLPATGGPPHPDLGAHEIELTN
jgi:Putative Flp pilus-assembly TadE/G-like